MPSALPRSKTEAAWEILARGARALGVTRGAIKGDIKISENGPIVGEIAARLSGGFMSGWTYPYASGREVTLGAMRIAMGMDPGLDTPEKELTSAERAFISIPGLVTRLSGVRKPRNCPG
jgi:biotin carboxylase